MKILSKDLHSDKLCFFFKPEDIAMKLLDTSNRLYISIKGIAHPEFLVLWKKKNILI